MVLEIDLHDLVAQTEHDGMLRSHPFLNIHRAWRVLKLVGLIQFIALNQSLLFLRIIVLLKIRLKMSEQGLDEKFDAFKERKKKMREERLRLLAERMDGGAKAVKRNKPM